MGKSTSTAVILLLLLLSALPTAAQVTIADPECAAWDSPRDQYLVTCWSSGSIVSFDTAGNSSYFKTSQGYTLACTTRDDVLYVSLGTSIRAYDLNTGNVLWTKTVSGSSQMDGPTTDTSGYLYIGNFSNSVSGQDRIYKLRLSDQTVSIFASDGLAQRPQDIVFDSVHNRLIVVGYTPNAPIQAISLEDSSITDLVTTPMGYLDGGAFDLCGNFYISCYGNGRVYRYDSTFSNPPELILDCRPSKPANLCYNGRDHVLAIPCYDPDTVIFLPVGQPKLGEVCMSDDESGNDNGSIDPGETVRLNVAAVNKHSADYTDVFARLTCTDPEVTIITDSIYIGTIPVGQTVFSSLDQFEITVDASHNRSMVSFGVTLTAHSDYGVRSASYSFEKPVGAPKIMLIDDDHGGSTDQYVRTSLVTLDSIYEVHDIFLCGCPTAEKMLEYNAVLWLTGDYQTNALTAEETAVLKEFLDAGGNLMLSGQGLASALDTIDADFLHNYLKAEFLRTYRYPYYISAANPQVMASGMQIKLEGTGSAANQTVLDHIQAINGGVEELMFYDETDWGAVSYDGEYRSVFLSFGLEAVTSGVNDWMDREDMLDQILTFFDWLNPHFCCRIRGDADYDNVGPNIADLVMLVTYMFQSGPAPVCMAEVDINGDNVGPDISDLVALVSYMFQGGSLPAPCL